MKHQHFVDRYTHSSPGATAHSSTPFSSSGSTGRLARGKRHHRSQPIFQPQKPRNSSQATTQNRVLSFDGSLARSHSERYAGHLTASSVSQLPNAPHKRTFIVQLSSAFNSLRPNSSVPRPLSAPDSALHDTALSGVAAPEPAHVIVRPRPRTSFAAHMFESSV